MIKPFKGMTTGIEVTIEDPVSKETKEWAFQAREVKVPADRRAVVLSHPDHGKFTAFLFYELAPGRGGFLVLSTSPFRYSEERPINIAYSYASALYHAFNTFGYEKLDLVIDAGHMRGLAMMAGLTERPIIKDWGDDGLWKTTVYPEDLEGFKKYES